MYVRYIERAPEPATLSSAKSNSMLVSFAGKHAVTVRRQWGYTIVEAMLALAIGGLLLTSATVLLNGTKGEADFNQAMHDLNSKIQTLVSVVSSGAFTASNRYDCSLSGSPKRPALLAISPGNTHQEGTSQDCLVLGKAIQVVPTTSQLYIYTVLGGRYYTDAGGQTISASQFDQTNPTAALADIGGDLTETYSLASKGAVLKAATYNDGAGRADMAGFYYDPSNSSGASRTATQPLLTKAYELRSDNPPDQQNNVQNYIEQQGGYNNIIINSWKLCFNSADAKQTAFLTISASREGVNTQLTFNTC